MKLRDFNIRWGRISKLFSPTHLGACCKCKTTWRFVKGHTTKYNEKSGVFPLCEKCWAELTPEQRLPYYWLLLLWWVNFDDYYMPDEERAALRAAVLAGK